MEAFNTMEATLVITHKGNIAAAILVAHVTLERCEGKKRPFLRQMRSISTAVHKHVQYAYAKGFSTHF